MVRDNCASQERQFGISGFATFLRDYPFCSRGRIVKLTGALGKPLPCLKAMVHYLSHPNNFEITLKSYALRLTIFNKFACPFLDFVLEFCIFEQVYIKPNPSKFLSLLFRKKYTQPIGLAKTMVPPPPLPPATCDCLFFLCRVGLPMPSTFTKTPKPHLPWFSI